MCDTICGCGALDSGEGASPAWEPREEAESVECERESRAAEAACERECEAPGPSLSPVTCRDCGAPFDVGGHKRRELRKEGKRGII